MRQTEIIGSGLVPRAGSCAVVADSRHALRENRKVDRQGPPAGLRVNRLKCALGSATRRALVTEHCSRVGRSEPRRLRRTASPVDSESLAKRAIGTDRSSEDIAISTSR